MRGILKRGGEEIRPLFLQAPAGEDRVRAPAARCPYLSGGINQIADDSCPRPITQQYQAFLISSHNLDKIIKYYILHISLS